MRKNLARFIYKRLLPFYFPKYGDNLILAIWCGIDIKKSDNLKEVLKGIRVTIRHRGNPILVIKKGEI